MPSLRPRSRRKHDPGWKFGHQVGTKTLQEAVDSGYKQADRLVASIEAFTGTPVASRRVLDFGCGWGRLALPLAERTEHVYGLDVSQSVLDEAAENAEQKNITNVEWLPAERLGELNGRYDLVVSVLVFQHIPAGEGERIIATLVRGLAPGGAGAINLILRPSHPAAGLARWLWRSITSTRSWSYPQMLRNSYSLNRVGRLLADGGATEWQSTFVPGRSFDSVTIIFRTG